MEPHILQQEVQKILDLMGVKTKSLEVLYDPELMFTIVSLRPGADTLLFRENNNEVQRALSTILVPLLNKKYHFYKDLILDINGDEIKLINHTKEKAAIAIERVIFFDQPYEFGYLNAYERMIIHRYLKKYHDLESQSTGEGKERRLQIIKKNLS